MISGIGGQILEKNFITTKDIINEKLKLCSLYSYILDITWTKDEGGGADGDNDDADDQVGDGEAHNEHVGHLEWTNEPYSLDLI